MKVLITEPECYTNSQLDELRRLGLELHISDVQLTQDDFDLLNEKLKPDIIILKLGISFGLVQINRNANIKIIVTPTTGTTHIDDQVSERVKIISLKGDAKFLASITSTAEHAWFLLLDAVRNSQNYFVTLDTQTWSRSDKTNINQISGKTLGIIGMGRLGKIIAQYAISFRMNVVFSEHKNESIELNSKKLDKKTISDVLEKSDYVIISANYLGEKILDAEILSRLRNPVDVLINISRGELIDEIALLQAVCSKKIGCYYTDVLTGDSSWSGAEFRQHPLYQASLKNNNIKITPHIGGYAREAIFAARSQVLRKLTSHIRSRP